MLRKVKHKKKIKILSLFVIFSILRRAKKKRKRKAFLVKIPFFTSQIVPYMELRSISREMTTMLVLIP